MRRLIVLNPQSRHGEAGRQFARLEPELRRRWGAVDVYRTRGPGDATARVRAVLRAGSHDLIIAAGGDGTIHEAMNGYFEGADGIGGEVPLGIIDLGTGGDLYRTLCRRSPDYQSALDEGRFQRVDCGSVRVEGAEEGARHFLNIASAGLGGTMLQNLKRSRFQAGAAAYFYHSIRALLAYQPVAVEIETVSTEGLRETREAELVNFFVCNGQYSGGGMRWAPGAALDSGHFELTLISGPRKLPLILHSRKVYTGRIAEFPGASQWRGREVILRGRQGLSLEADGEVIPNEDTGLSSWEVRFALHPGVFPLVM